MLTKWNFNNNVRVTLNQSITAGSTSIIINKASAPFRDPPVPSSDSAGGESILTLMDSASAPTKIEIVTYSTYTDNSDGTITLGITSRGNEGTTAQAFSAGAVVIQAVTNESLNSDFLQINNQSGVVLIPGNGVEGPLVDAGVNGSNGFRLRYSGDLQNVIDVARVEHGANERIWGLMTTNDADLLVNVPPPTDPTNPYFPIIIDWNGFMSGDKATVYMRDALSVDRIEQVRAVRIQAQDPAAFVSNTTVDWGSGDVLQAALAGSANLTFTDSSDFSATDGPIRRLTLLITIANVANPGYTITWPASVKWPGGVAPTFNTGQNQIRRIDFFYDGTYYLADTMQTYQL